MATISSYATAAGKRWEVRYRTPSRTTTRKRGFKTKRDAETFATSVESSKLRGEYVSASAGRVALRELAPRWLEGSAVRWKPKTHAANRGALDTHVLPRWADVYVVDVAHSDVKAWVAELAGRRGAATVRRAHNVLAMILDDAVRDGRVPKNVARGVPLPRKTRKERAYLSHAQVQALAAVAGDLRPVVLTLAYTGLRWGELAALKVGRVDMLRRRLEVVENVVDVDGRLVWGTPKTHESRSVPFPAFLGVELAAAMAGKGPDELVFTGARGGVLRHNTSRRRHFDPAVQRAGTAVSRLQVAVGMPASARTGVYDDATEVAVRGWQGRHGLPVTGRADRATWGALAAADRARSGRAAGGGRVRVVAGSADELEALAVLELGPGSRDFPRLTPHDLRHTAASLAVSAGANVKAVQRMLGHASAAMTLDTYADLFDDDLDAVAVALDAAALSVSVSNPCPSPGPALSAVT